MLLLVRHAVGRFRQARCPTGDVSNLVGAVLLCQLAGRFVQWLSSVQQCVSSRCSVWC